MTPLADIGRHNDFRFEAVREHCAGLLRGQAVIQKVKIRLLRNLASNLPVLPAFGAPCQEERLNDRDLAAELILAVVAVAGALLTIGCHPVPDDLMADATVTNEFHGKAAMLQNCLVTALDDTGNELRGAVVRDLALGFVADAPAPLKALQNYAAVNGRDELEAGLNNLHRRPPP